MKYSRNLVHKKSRIFKKITVFITCPTFLLIIFHGTLKTLACMYVSF